MRIHKLMWRKNENQLCLLEKVSHCLYLDWWSLKHSPRTSSITSITWELARNSYSWHQPPLVGSEALWVEPNNLSFFFFSFLKTSFAGDSNANSNLRTTDLDNYLTLLLGFPSANMPVIAMEMHYHIVHMQLSLIFREQTDLARTPWLVPISSC